MVACDEMIDLLERMNISKKTHIYIYIYFVSLNGRYLLRERILSLT